MDLDQFKVIEKENIRQMELKDVFTWTYATDPRLAELSKEIISADRAKDSTLADKLRQQWYTIRYER